MNVTLKLAGAFVHAAGFSHRELDVAPGTTIADLLAELPVDRGRPMLIARNGHGAAPEDEVHPGDRILVSPVFSGG